MSHIVGLNGVLRLGASAAAVRTVRVAREFHHIRFLQSKHVLEPPANCLQNLLALRRCASTLVTGDAFAHGACPQTDTVETLAHVHDHPHNLVVIVALEGLADGSQLCVQPEIINRNRALVLELVGPLATVFVLRVFPFWSYALLEEMVVGLETEFGGRRDVVLDKESQYAEISCSVGR